MNFKKFNIIDYCIVAFLALIVVFAGVRIFVFGNMGAETVSSGQTKCELVLVAESVLSEFAENIQTAGEVYTQEEELMGLVKMVKLTDSYMIVKKNDGMYKKVLNPERKMVSITVESVGKQTDEGLRIYGNREVAVGRDYFIMSNDTVYQMRLTEINIMQK